MREYRVCGIETWRGQYIGVAGKEENRKERGTDKIWVHGRAEVYVVPCWRIGSIMATRFIERKS